MFRTIHNPDTQIPRQQRHWQILAEISLAGQQDICSKTDTDKYCFKNLAIKDVFCYICGNMAFCAHRKALINP